MYKVMLLAVCAMTTSAVFATQCFWQGPAGGDWWQTANWKDGVRPGTSDVAVFNSSFTEGRSVTITNADEVQITRIYVKSGAWTIRVAGTLALPGDRDTPTVLAEGTSTLTFDGGILDGICYRADGTSQIKFHNTVNRGGMNYRRSTTQEGTGQGLVFDSGVQTFRTLYARLYENYQITGGSVTVGSFHGGDQYGESKMSREPMPLTITGGKFKIDGVDTALGGNSGVGIGASGNAVVEIVPGGSSMWMADRQKKTWRISEYAWFKAPGPYMATAYNNSTATVEVVGGRFQMTSNVGGISSSSESKDGRRSEMLLDGGILDIDYSASGNLQGSSVKDETTGHFLTVGANGGTIRNRNNVTLTTGAFLPQQDSSVSDGGLVLKGLGSFDLNKASTYVGGTTVSAPVVLSTTAGALGTGNVTLKNGGTLKTSAAGTTLPALTVDGQGLIAFSSATASLTCPSLAVAEKGGALVLDGNTNYDKCGKDRDFLSFTTAPTRRTDGLFTIPVFLSVPGYSNSAREMHLAAWDATNQRVVGATYTEGWGDETNISYVTESANLTECKHVGALVLRGAFNGMSAWNTITVGNGSGNAYVCMNGYSNGKWACLDNTKLIFGTAHGVIAVGNKVSGVDTGSPYLNGFIEGSAGVSFVGMDGAGFRLYRPQSYTGTTRVLGGELMLMNDASLSSGSVEVTGGESHGGTVRFLGTTADFANDFTISGFGTGGTTKKGALSFESETVLSGMVTLADDALICATASKEGTLTYPIKGTGDLYLGGDGLLNLAGVWIDGDIHVAGNVTTTGEIDNDGKFLFVDGTLTFNNSEDITVNAKVLGAGTIVLAGSGKVDFTDLALFEGQVDLAGNSATIGALNGLVAITNSLPVDATLTISGSSDSAYFGAVSDYVDLEVSGKLLLGPTADVRTTSTLSLAGGTLGLYEDRIFSRLEGTGAVTGRQLCVDATAPNGTLTFETYPTLGTLSYGWRLKANSTGGWIVTAATGLNILFY